MVMDSIDNPKQPVKESAESPRHISRVAVRHDGVILVSLEDAGDCDLTGREVVMCLVLTQEEAARVRFSVEEGAYTAASFILGELPKLLKRTADGT
jgi:hypothetical protein